MLDGKNSIQTDRILHNNVCGTKTNRTANVDCDTNLSEHALAMFNKFEVHNLHCENCLFSTNSMKDLNVHALTHVKSESSDNLVDSRSKIGNQVWQLSFHV